ncbi:tail fiber domain-containing protein [Bacteroides salyersiae]|uniref:tail fiber domain-containing protein n=1 Tax=Bacteroides salyersiae TaxID=291644 RepID=UPI001C8BAEDC|nr:tail fiber domain-containing protein [Bacteroides salyersiae]
MQTKKLLVTSFLFLLCIQISAQVKVLPNGKVGIGTNDPQYGALEIGKSGVDNGLAIYDSLSTTPPLKLYTLGEIGYLNFDGIPAQGIAIKKNGHIGFGYNPNINSSLNQFINVHIHPSNPAAAFAAYVNLPFDYGDVVSVVSRRKTDLAYVVRNGISGNNEIVYYARADGEVYAKGSFLTASDGYYKDNVVDINNGLDKIKKIRGVTYTLKNQDIILLNQNNIEENCLLDTNILRSSVPTEIINTIKTERLRKKAGFIAQELEEVFPEAVYTLPNGKKAIAYSEIIPLLVEAIKEQQSEIDELKQSEIIRTGSVISDETDETEHIDTNSLMDNRLNAKLYSNIPNPFKEQTVISFFIPETASQASIHIYNLQGNQIKQIRIEKKGHGSVVINGYELTPGMYMYTLIVDGKEIDTKKMILTE